MEPGMYVLRDDDPAYLDAVAAAIRDPSITVVRTHQIGDGLREVTFEVGGERRLNPPPVDPWTIPKTRKLLIPREYFQTPLNTYSAWREAWWREAVQNAVDAGATEIHCDVSEEADSYRISCTDNGGGMTPDVLMNVFMALSGTTKEGAEGETGGFGKAKELLLFPWLRYMVHTGSVAIYGSTDDYTEPQPAAPIQGTIVAVWMDKEKYTTADRARSFIRQCNLPHVRFNVNEEVVVANRLPGRLVETLEGESGVTLEIYYNEEATGVWGNYIPVRTNGLWMFNQYFDGDLDAGQVTAEMVGRSYDALLDSREEFRDRSLKHALVAFTQRLATDMRQTLQSKKGLTKKIYRGERDMVRESESLAADLMAAVRTPLRPKNKDPKKVGLDADELEDQVMDKEDVLNIIIAAQEMEERTPLPPPQRPMEVITPPEVIKIHLEQGLRTPEDVQNAMMTLAWMPDLYVVNEVEDFKIPSQYLPTGKGMAAIPYRVLRLWAEMCRFVMIGMGVSKPFGVGWVVSLDTGGEWRREPDPETGEVRDWLLFNPLRVSTDYTPFGSRQEYRHAARVRLSDEDTLADMFAVACHEVVHLMGYTAHNDEFSYVLTDVMGRMLQRWPIVRKLKAAVTKATKGGTKKSGKTTAKGWAKAKAGGWERTGVSPGDAADEIRAAFPSVSISESVDIAYDVLYPGP